MDEEEESARTINISTNHNNNDKSRVLTVLSILISTMLSPLRLLSASEGSVPVAAMIATIVAIIIGRCSSNVIYH